MPKLLNIDINDLNILTTDQLKQKYGMSTSYISILRKKHRNVCAKKSTGPKRSVLSQDKIDTVTAYINLHPRENKKYLMHTFGITYKQLNEIINNLNN